MAAANHTVAQPLEQGGFTLIELMVVLAILAVLLMLAAPGFQELIRNNRMVSEVYALRATLNNARSEALARRSRVKVCPSADGATCDATNSWGQGYMSFMVADGMVPASAVPDPNDPAQELFQWENRETSGVDIDFNNAAQFIVFDARGTALDSDGIFVFCDERGAEDASGLFLAPGGSISAAVDTDTPEDGIVDDDNGNNVSC